MTLEAILFDMDGTLVDSIGLIVASYRHAMTECYGAAPADELFVRGIGTPLRTQFAELARSPEDVDRLVESYSTSYRAGYDMLSLYPGILEVMERISQLELRTAIVTSKSRAGTMRTLAHFGIERLFEVIVAADDVEHGKPDPQPVLSALQQLGVRADHAVFVGDSPHDMISGRRAGVHTAAALWGPFDRVTLSASEPDAWLDAPEGLFALIDKLRDQI